MTKNPKKRNGGKLLSQSGGLRIPLRLCLLHLCFTRTTPTTMLMMMVVVVVMMMTPTMMMMMMMLMHLLPLELLPHVISILPIRIILCLHIMNLVAQGLCVQIECSTIALPDM